MKSNSLIAAAGCHGSGTTSVPDPCVCKTILLVTLLSTFLTFTARAQSILDQQLGPAPADAKKDAAATPPKPAAPKTDGRPIVPELVDPNAAKTIDDADLIKKLTNADPGAKTPQGGPGEAMKNMVDHMGQSQTRLTGADTGAVTQETQRRINADLDVLIEYARQQQNNGPSQHKPQDQQAEKRQQSSGQKQGGRSHEGGSQSATDENQRGGGALTPESNGADIHQKGGAEWGNLPGKDRDLVSNGVNEQYLPSYKEMIDRYYQALAEIGKSKDH